MMEKQLDNSEILRRMRTGVSGLGRVLNSLFSFNPAGEALTVRRQVSITMGAGFLSIAHGTRAFNRVRLRDCRTYRFQEIKHPAPETVAETAAHYLGGTGLKNPEVTLCIPKAWSVIRTTELPAVTRENLSGAVAFELDRITPFSSEDAYYDYKILKEEKGTLRVAVTAARRDAVDPYLKALAERGLPVTRIVTNLSAASAYLDYALNERDFIYLDISPGSYEAGFFISGVPAAGCSGSLNGAGPDERVVQDIADEMAPWIENAAKNASSPRIIVRSSLGDSYPALEKKIRIPFRTLKSGDIKIPGFTGGGSADCVSHTAIGGMIASLRPRQSAMNLLTRGKTENGKPPLALTFMLVAVLLIMGAAAIGLPLYSDHQTISLIERELSVRKDEIKKIEALRKEESSLTAERMAVEKFKQNSPKALEILAKLTDILPKSVWLTRVLISDAKVSLEGYASSATDILPIIESSDSFSGAEFASPTTRDARMNAERFVIRAEVEGVKKETERKDEKK